MTSSGDWFRMMYDLVVRAGRVVRADDHLVADVGVVDGVVAAIERDLEGGGAEVIDASGLVILPGAVDAHVHLNDPGRADWEGFATGTAALAAGGTTTAIDMPLNAIPPTLDGASFTAKRAAARGAARVDVALWGGLVPGADLDDLDELANAGAIGFKAFMSASGVEEFPAADDLTLVEGMARAARLGLPVAVHAESDVLTSRLAARAVASGRTSMRDYLASRPVVAELEAIGRAIAFADDTGCALHVVHVSSGRGVALVAEARARGVDVTCETCPHYLVLDEDDAVRLGAVAKCAPPLRPGIEVEALWDRVLARDVDMVATDHSPSPAELKETGDDLFAAWGGIPGGQTLVALLYDSGVVARGLELERLGMLVAGMPALRFGLAPAKGSLAVGADADMVLLDPGRDWTVDRDDLLDRHRLSPFVGRTLRGRVVRTILRGQTIAADGHVLGEPHGRVLRRGGGPA
jgi:allantoinase